MHLLSLLLYPVDKPPLVLSPDLEELLKEADVLGVPDERLEVPQVDEPLALVLDLLGDQIGQLPVRVVDPPPGVPSVGDKHEAFLRQEKGKVPEEAILFLKQDLILHLRAEGNLVAGHQAEVAHPDQIRGRGVVEDRDSLDPLLVLFRREVLLNLLYKHEVDAVKDLKMSG